MEKTLKRRVSGLVGASLQKRGVPRPFFGILPEPLLKCQNVSGSIYSQFSFFVFSLVRPDLYNAYVAGTGGRMDSAHLVITARVFEVEERMIAQNDPLDEAVHP